MTKMTKDAQGENGNTKHSPLTSKMRYRNLFFTFNNYELKDIDQMTSDFKGAGAEYLFQEEIGKGGTKHLQGVAFFKQKKSFKQLKEFNPKIHWEKLRNKKAGIEYCRKTETRNGKQFTNMKLRKSIKDPLCEFIRDNTLKPYQKEILNRIKNKPDDRKIYWFWDEAGNIGKTVLAKHICMNYNALYVTGKCADIKYGVVDFIKNKDLDICLFGLPRTYEEYVSYEAIESIKDGIFYSGKYESGMVIFNTPHIIILANFPPNTEKLSKDRWVIKEIKE